MGDFAVPNAVTYRLVSHDSRYYLSRGSSRGGRLTRVSSEAYEAKTVSDLLFYLQKMQQKDATILISEAFRIEKVTRTVGKTYWVLKNAKGEFFVGPNGLLPWTVSRDGGACPPAFQANTLPGLLNAVSDGSMWSDFSTDGPFTVEKISEPGSETVTVLE